MNRPRRTDTWRSNILDYTDVLEIGQQLATVEDDGPFRIGLTLACLQQTWKLPRRTSHQTTTLRRGPDNQQFFWEKVETYPLGQCHQKGSVYQETSNVTRLESKGYNTRWRMASERQIIRLPVLLDVKLIWQQISLCQPTRTPVHHPHQRAEAMTDTS